MPWPGSRAADLPVLFLDTCSIVDPIRTPLRPEELRGCIEAAQELLRLVATAPARCTPVIASFVHGEWLAPRWSGGGQAAGPPRPGRCGKRSPARPLRATWDHAAIPPVGVSRPSARRSAPRHLPRAARRRDPAGPGPGLHHPGPRAGLHLHAPIAEGWQGEGLDDHRGVPRSLAEARGRRLRAEADLLHVEHEGLLRGRSTPSRARRPPGEAGLGFATNLPWAVHELKTA